MSSNIGKWDILQGNCLEVLKTLPDCSVNMCVTSPPYYGLRDYGTGTWVGGDPECKHRKEISDTDSISSHITMRKLGISIANGIYKSVCKDCGAVRVDEQIGLEESPSEYVEKLRDVFHEVKRVLTDDGILFLNLGDSYNTSYKWDRKYDKACECGLMEDNKALTKKISTDNVKKKDMFGIPWQVAFALRDDGWYLRQEIIWRKENCMPESVTDRFTNCHEHIFLLTKSEKYYFDHDNAQEPCVDDNGWKRYRYEMMGGKKEQDGVVRPNSNPNTQGFKTWTGMRNMRDVWDINTKPYKESHFATFPLELPERCVLVGCPEGGTVLDPFNGAATTGVASIIHNRNYLGIELNPEYIKLSEKRLNEYVGVETVTKEDSDGNSQTLKMKKEDLF